MSDVKRARTSTDPVVLGRLARESKSKHVRKALAGNPNAPWDVLCELLSTHPGEVLSNPALPLLLLSDPGLFQHLPVAALRGLAAVRDQLGQLVGWTEDPPWTELQATLACVAHARHRIPFGDRHKPSLSSLRRTLVERQLLPDDLELHLVNDPDEGVRRALARTSKAAQVIESLLADDHNHENLASNQHLPTCYQWAMAATGTRAIRLRLARNPGVSTSVLEQLAHDPDEAVRAAVALASRTPRVTWERLTWDSNPGVQTAARRARRPGGRV